MFLLSISLFAHLHFSIILPASHVNYNLSRRLWSGRQGWGGTGAAAKWWRGRGRWGRLLRGREQPWVDEGREEGRRESREEGGAQWGGQGGQQGEVGINSVALEWEGGWERELGGVEEVGIDTIDASGSRRGQGCGQEWAEHGRRCGAGRLRCRIGNGCDWVDSSRRGVG